MTYIRVNPLTCLSHGHDYEVLEDLLNNLSRNTYDGEGGASLLSHIVAFMGFCERNEIHEHHVAYSLFNVHIHVSSARTTMVCHIACNIHSLL